MVDLTAKPFYLDDAALDWVQSTIDAMTLEEKNGQHFNNLNVAFTPGYLDHVLDRFHVGGIRFRGTDAATVQAHIRYAQAKSKIPLLVASNPEMGGFGSVDDGTRVKDTVSNLPLRPETHPRIRLYGITGQSDFTGTDPTEYLRIAQEELERAGFKVHVFKNAQQRIAEGERGVTFHSILSGEANSAYPEQYDAAIVFANVSGFAQEATIRIHWSSPLAAEIPWYATEVPTVFVSLSLPNHLIDVPMVKTVIHAYAPSREAIRATVEKIQGKSPFQGTFNENVFCDTFGTRR
jgi:hypothetical protein